MLVPLAQQGTDILVRSVHSAPLVMNSLDFSFQLQHCQDGIRGFFAFVTEFSTRPLNSLGQRITSEQAKADWNLVFEADFAEAEADKPIDVLVMAGLALDHHTQGDDSMKAAAPGGPTRGQGEFPSAGDRH